jgi:prepilin-type N-terminal cleavage/methylation domain-containing protein
MKIYPLRAQEIRGMTLIEVLVAIAVMLIAMEGFTFLFLKTWDTNKFVLEEGMASAAASRATNKIVIQLRAVQQADNGDYPIESADDFDLVFYCDVDDDGVVERVHYFLDQANDELKMGVSNPLATNPITYPSSDNTVTVVTSYVVNDASNPIFYYYNDDYPGDTVNNPLSTPANVGDIQMVQVHLYVNINPVHAPDNINIESFVDLRNLHDYE